MRKANVICVVYAVGKAETFESITSFWLPLIRKLGVNVPVILVGNKMDAREGPTRSLEEDFVPIMNAWKVPGLSSICSPLRYPDICYPSIYLLCMCVATCGVLVLGLLVGRGSEQEVETCIECSAMRTTNVSEVFYFAQKSVLYPTAPLYDGRDHVIILIFFLSLLLLWMNG